MDNNNIMGTNNNIMDTNITNIKSIKKKHSFKKKKKSKANFIPTWRSKV